jgi:hypothetical protein
LGKEFLLNLKKENQELHSVLIGSLRVRGEDFVRYFGEDYGNRLAFDIENFLLNDFEDKTLSPLLRQQKRQPQTTSNVLTNDFIPGMLSALREGYEEKCRKEGRRINVHHTLTIDELLELDSSTHPFALSEAIDENCDLGYLVPRTELIDGVWRRTYRTGEPNPAELSVAIIALAIAKMGILQGKTRFKAQPETVFKVLANYCFDFPSESSPINEKTPDYRHIHTLISRPADWGPQPLFMDTDTKERVSLYKPDEFSAKVARHWIAHEGKRTYFTTTRTVISWVSKLLGDLGKEDSSILLINDYFDLMKFFKEKTKTDDSLNALCICRDERFFLEHVMCNLKKWGKKYKDFLGMITLAIKRAKVYSESTKSGPLHSAAAMTHSLSSKIGYPSKLKNGWLSQLRRIVDEEPVRFQHVLQKIESESSWVSPDAPLLEKLSTLIHAISGVTNLSLAMVKGRRELKDNTDVIALETIGCNIDIEAFLNSQDRKKNLNKLSNCYDLIKGKIEELHAPQNSESTRIDVYYAKRARNFIGTRIQTNFTDNGWVQVHFLSIDLSDSSWVERDGHTFEAVLGEFYEVVEKYLDEFGGIYKKPEGDDGYMVLFGGEGFKGIETARAIQEHFKKRCNRGKDNPRTIEVKYGLSTVIGKDNILDRQKQNTAMGIAKDCCELVQEFVNKKDIVCSKSFKEVSAHFCKERRWVWRELPHSYIKRGGKKLSVYRLSNMRRKKGETEHVKMELPFS